MENNYDYDSIIRGSSCTVDHYAYCLHAVNQQIYIDTKQMNDLHIVYTVNND